VEHCTRDSFPIPEDELEEADLMEYLLTPKSEIDNRIKAFQSQMSDIDGALLFQSADVCYFSGTAQDGLVYVPKNGEPVVMMRRSL
jgi:Xaa-Pro dipeptidase